MQVSELKPGHLVYFDGEFRTVERTEPRGDNVAIFLRSSPPEPDMLVAADCNVMLGSDRLPPHLRIDDDAYLHVDGHCWGCELKYVASGCLVSADLSAACGSVIRCNDGSWQIFWDPAGSGHSEQPMTRDEACEWLISQARKVLREVANASQQT